MNMREKIRRVLEDKCYVVSNNAVDAVLDALMEPTEGMANVGLGKVLLLESRFQTSFQLLMPEQKANAIFTAMIQAARDGA